MAHDYDIGIIGGGAAGLTVASGSAQLGARTLLIEKEPELGGDCLHHGCVPSKTLIHSASAYQLMKRAEQLGLPRIDPGPVDFSRIAARIREVIQTIQKHDSVERFCGLGAKVEFGQPEFLDEHSVRLNGRTVSAAKWVLTTGSSPGLPPIPGLDETPYLTNKDIFTLDALPESMLILGAGPIAIEMAQAFCRLGTRVAIIQRGPQILSREDSDLAEMLMREMEAEGVTFRLNTTVESVRAPNGTPEVVCKTGDGSTRDLSAQTLLVALGRKPNTSGLGLDNAGVEVTSKGIPVDAKMRSNQKHIFAAGDVTGQYQFTHAAGYEGGIVVANAVLRFPRKARYGLMPHCTYAEPELASIGLNEKRTRAQNVDYSLWEEDFSSNDRALAEGTAVGKIKMLLGKDKKPLGVQILGPRAGDLLAEWVAVLGGKSKLSTLVGAVHPYPTLAEINKRVAGNYLGPKLFSETVKKTLKFFFSYKGRACELPLDLREDENGRPDDGGRDKDTP